MTTTIRAKQTRYGTVEIQQSGTNYYLVINGRISKYSSDLAYIIREYDCLG